MIDIKSAIKQLSEGVDLHPDESSRAFQAILNAGATPAQMAGFFDGATHER